MSTRTRDAPLLEMQEDAPLDTVGKSASKDSFPGDLLIPEQKATLPYVLSTISAIAIMSSLAFGVGIFMVPAIFSSLGLIFGGVVTAGFGALTATVWEGVIDLAMRKNVTHPEDVFRLMPGGVAIARTATVMALLTGNCAHMQLVAGLLFDLFAWFVTGHYGTNDTIYMPWKKGILISLLVSLAMPWCFAEDLSGLRHVGKILAGTVMFTVIVVVGNCFALWSDRGLAPEEDAAPVWINTGPTAFEDVMRSVPTLCFIYAGGFSVMGIYAAMHSECDVARRHPECTPEEYPTTLPARRLKRALRFAGVVQAGFCVMIGLVGALTFGTKIGSKKGNASESNVLYNFPADNYVITFLCLLLVVAIVLDYAIVNHPIVTTLKNSGVLSRWPGVQRQIISLVLGAIVVCVDMFIPDLTDLFGLCGALGCALFCLVLPGALVALDKDASVGTRAFGGSTAFIGMTVLTVSTFFTCRHIVTGK